LVDLIPDRLAERLLGLFAERLRVFLATIDFERLFDLPAAVLLRLSARAELLIIVELATLLVRATFLIFLFQLKILRIKQKN
jgi:hypothetical protein